MADGLGVVSGVTALVAFAFKSSTILYRTIYSFRSLDENTHTLKNELADLRRVLQLLAETVDNNDDINFDALKLPLLRCGRICEEYGDFIARYAKHPSSSRPSFWGWVNQQYLKGDRSDVRELLAGYKSTINIALANANMRVIPSITSGALKEYLDMISDTTNDLQEHMDRLDERLRALAGSEVESPSKDESRWMAMLEEKQSTQEGLKICSQLSAQIDQLETTSKEHLQFLQQPPERKFIRNELGESCQSLVLRLQTHERSIYNRIQTMKSSGPLSGDEAIQIAEFQETIEAIRQSMNLVASAGQILSYEQRNILDDPERMSLSSASSSELDTLFSKGYSDRSSEYSVSGLSSTAEEQLVELILDHTVLRPLLQQVCEATTSTGSQRQITHFFHRYGKDLQQEAETTAQLTAAGFVRRSARRVAGRISTSIQSSAYNSIRDSSTDEPGSTKVLRRYIESLSSAGTFANVSNADEETDLVPPDDLGDDEPQSLEEVRAFLLSSRALASLCDGIREWLKQHKDPPIQTCHNDSQRSMNPQSTQSRLEHKSSALIWIWSRLPNSVHEISWFSIAAVRRRRVLCEPRISPNQDRLRWRCSCGQMLYGDFDNTNSQAFYELATSLKTLSSTERSNMTSPSCNTCPAMQEQTTNPPGLPPCDAEATSNLLGSGVRNLDHRAEDSIDSSTRTSAPTLQDQRPTLRKTFFEVCVNSGEHAVRLGEIDITSVSSDAELFGKIWTTYDSMKRSWPKRIFIRPCGIQFVYFGVRHRYQAGIYKGPLEIPPVGEVTDERYHYYECPLKVLPPMPAGVFLHYLSCAKRKNWVCEAPEAHAEGFFLQRLPKKVHHSILDERKTCGNLEGSTAIAFGWGVHILEGPDHGTLSIALGLGILLSLIISLVVCGVAGTQEQGFGIGQFLLAVIACMMAALYFKLQEL